MADRKLAELIERMSGRWQVSGPGIDGVAEFRPVDHGRLLVADVDFVVHGQPMKVIQHISHHEDTDTLRARYLDTAGGSALYTWSLDGRTLRVSLADAAADTYFEATFDDDFASYTGSWHYPPGSDDGAADERIVYSRLT